MLLPIDLIVAVLYWSINSQSQTGPSNVFAVLLVAITALAAVEIITRLAALYAVTRNLRGPDLRNLTGSVNVGARVLLLLAFIFQIEEGGWPGTITFEYSQALTALVGLAPFIIMLSLSWFSFYKLDRLLVPGRWRIFPYVIFRLRYSVFVLVPWVCVWVLHDLLMWGLPEEWIPELLTTPWLAQIMVLGLMAVAIILFPVILIRLWGCKPLEDEKLLAHLEELQQRAKVRFARVYSWRLGGNTMLNGAVLGFLPHFRYLLLSRGLLAHLTEEEIRGVVAHELGHVRHHHLLYYLFVTAAFITGLINIFLTSVTDSHMLAIIIGLGVAFYFRFIFGYLSRQFERQADLFALELLGSSAPLIQSLEKIAFLSGDVREAKCWHHSSIARRVEYLKEAENNPEIPRHHNTLCRHLQLGLMSLAIFIFAYAGSGVATTPARPATGSQATLGAEWFAHWQRIRELIPEDGKAPLKMAELLLSGEVPAKLSGEGSLDNAVRSLLDEAASKELTPEEEDRLHLLRRLLRDGGGEKEHFPQMDTIET